MELNDIFLEKLMIKSMLIDSAYLVSLSSTFNKKLFQDQTLGDCFEIITNHYLKYNVLPPKEIVIQTFDTPNQQQIKFLFEEIDAIDFDYVKNYSFLFDKTDAYLKEQSLKGAILEAVDIIEKKKDKFQVRELIESALSKSLMSEIGLDYFGTLGERFKRLLQTAKIKIPSYFFELDNFINGGFPPYTLNLILGAVHSGKSSWIANLAARQILNGHNIAIISLEMSEDMYAQRIDGILSKLDINKMYTNIDTAKKLGRILKPIKERKTRGNLYIKQFPTGEASRNDFSKYIKELQIRGIKLDMIYIDYLNLMKSTGSTIKDGLYSNVKKIAEELRALSFEFELPVFSASQLNRGGALMDFQEVDFNYVSESLGVVATVDFVAILGMDEDKLVYENTINYKISKNRLGGRTGEIGTFYYDKKSLKMYDSNELDTWMEDASISNDERNISEIPSKSNNEEKPKKKKKYNN